MLKRAFCSVVNLFVIVLHLQLVSSQLPADQVSAMTSIYEIIQNNASSFVWNNVLKTSNPCSWEGVGCTSDNSSINTISLYNLSISTSEFLPFVCNISTLESLDVSFNKLRSIPDGFFTVCGEISGLKVLDFSFNLLNGSLPSFNNGFRMLEKLDFSVNYLSGEISLQLDGLDSLKILDLNYNYFIGKIPRNLAKMNLLKELHLSDNYFRGEFLPYLCNISTLESLDVSYNRLRSIPDGFFTVCGEISGLKVLDFSHNLLNGSLPSFNNGFRMLEKLDFSFNDLSGEISLQLDGLDSLKILDLSYNHFIGKIPRNLAKMNLLKKLDLSSNSFRGEIPIEISKNINLSVIDLSSNELVGSIPGELGDLTMLWALVLYNNHLIGGIPASLSNITTLEWFEADNNNLNGTIPSGITWHLKYLSLEFNRLTGFMPSDLLSGPNLQGLFLSSNHLVGPFPTINSTNLHFLILGNNSLTGTLPPSLANLTNLEYLNLEFNNFVGPIPPEISQLDRLEELIIGVNSLNGSIPDSFRNLSSLRELQLGNNQLNGRIPNSLSMLTNLRVLDMQGNNLQGGIPDSLKYLSSLRELQLGNNQLNGRIQDMPQTLEIAVNLSYNLLDGHIPFSLSRLGSLKVLDLSNNRLSGRIPNFLTDLFSLTQLLLMNNNLSGVVPRFGNDVEVDTRGNKYLLYPSLPRENPSLEIPHMKRNSSIDSDFVIVGVASGFPVGLLISVIAIFISRRYYNSIRGNLSTPNSIHRLNVDLKKGLEAAADPSNIILKSAFSAFYKAVMPSEVTYLVKKINHSRNIFKFPRHKQLVEELELLGNLSNPNVMIPVAYVLTPRRAYLFYDFVRGTLHDILHRPNGKSTLDWARRYNIAVGVARGLAFLHECSSGPIILLDLSTKTILLKSIDEPQISDIELCKLIHPSTCATSVGYAPPEYGCTKRVTGAGNVYSFGVVLLELLTGKPAVSEGTELAKWVLSSSKYDQILDSNVSENETSTVVRDQMLGVLDVALACISVSPEMRPNMVHVLQMLLSKR